MSSSIAEKVDRVPVVKERNMPGKLIRVSVLLAFALCAFSATVSAQTATGRVIGTVSDAQGAVVPDAKVSVTNTATGITSTTVTNANGYYEVLALPIGPYKVSVEKSGFRIVATGARQLQIN